MILGWCCYGVDFHIYTTFKPKESTKTGLDLSGHKMRSTATYRPFLSAMGAIPVTMAAAEMYTGLQRGVVQGLAWPEGALAKYGVQKFLKYRVYPGFYRSGSMVLINIDKWKTLSKSVQDKLTETGLAFEQGSEPILRKKADADNKKLWASGPSKNEARGRGPEGLSAHRIRACLGRPLEKELYGSVREAEGEDVPRTLRVAPSKQ